MGRDTIISGPNSKKIVFEDVEKITDVDEKQKKPIIESDVILDEISTEEIVNANKSELKIILWRVTNSLNDIIRSMNSFIKFFTDFTERDEKILKVITSFNERDEKILNILTSINDNIVKSVESKSQAIKVLQGTYTPVDDCSKNKTLMEINDKLQELINLWK